MDFDQYRTEGKNMVDYIADYLQNIRSRRVFPDVSPGYMRHLVPDSAPDVGEPWTNIFRDVERVVMPGVTHWQSPHMHAYFPALNSFPSLLGDMLADAIGCLGFTWASSPACTELEIIVMDWLAKMIGLPSEFFHSNKETMGGGVIQTTASEATFVSLLAARTEAIKKYRAKQPDLDDAEINARLVGYCSDQAHSSVEKAGLIGLVKMRLLMSDEQLSLRGKTLADAIERDRQNGLIPFYVCATLGTTGACAFDNLLELGPICEAEGLWMHIDAAYAGTAFICPEFRVFLSGVEYAKSIAFNPSKWMMVHFDCTAMWVKDSRTLHRTFNVQPLYLRHENTGSAIDYMHWQVPLSKRFRALKLWFVIRSFGVKGLQEHVRKGVNLANKFEQLVAADDRFEVAAKRHLGMVVFRLKGDNGLTEILLRKLNSSGAVHMVPASLQGRYVIRFTVTSYYTSEADIDRDWTVIRSTARDLMASISPEPTTINTGKEPHANETSAANRDDFNDGEDVELVADEGKDKQKQSETVSGDMDKVSDTAIQRKRDRLRQRGDFGMSLMLSNVPMSPKFINGSFAALFDSVELVNEFARHISRSSESDLNGSPIRMSPRRRPPYLVDGANKKRQYSLDCGFNVMQGKEQHEYGGSNGGRLGNLGNNQMTSGAQQAGGLLGVAGRQGSLDSKIEEIFQASTPTPVNEELESGDAPTDDDSCEGVEIAPDVTGGSSKQPVDTYDEPTTTTTTTKVTASRHEQKTTKINGQKSLWVKHCKHCGRDVDED